MPPPEGVSVVTVKPMICLSIMNMLGNRRYPQKPKYGLVFSGILERRMYERRRQGQGGKSCSKLIRVAIKPS